MPFVCALFTHFGSPSNSLTCLQRLAEQQRPPEHVLLINNAAAGIPLLEEARAFAQEQLPHSRFHILQMPDNLGNAGGCEAGMRHAFEQLGADFVWILDDDSWPRPTSLAALLDHPVEAETVRMSLVIDPTREDELSWPLTARADGSQPWSPIAKRAELPAGEAIASRGGWLGALYPRLAWERCGGPTPELFIRGEDEEYPWKLRDAGFRFVTLVDSPLEHPSSRCELLRYQIGPYYFFYEPGLAPSRHYYKNRNWAWLQRLRFPAARQIPRRLVACGVYIIFSMHAMLRRWECSPTRIFQLFRALHNGFYGKLRPY